MFNTLNALEEKEAISIFNQLLQDNEKFAFNTLDCILPTSTLFKTLLYQLDPQQKEDYRVHLKTKSTFKAKYTPREFYLNNKESVNNLSTENSNEPLVQNRDDLPAAHFSPISPAFEETVVEHTFDSRPDFSYENEPLVNKRKRAEENQLYSQIIRSITGQRSQDLCFTAYNSLTECELEKICTVEPPAKLQCISVPPFEGFAEFHNQFSNMVTENSTASSSLTSNENISDSLESELTFLESQINGGEPLTSLQSSLKCESIARVQFLSKLCYAR